MIDSEQPHLDPFALPSETNGRFLMLVLATAMIALYTTVSWILVPGSLDIVSPFAADFPLAQRAFLRTEEIVGDRNILGLSAADILRLSADLRAMNVDALALSIPRLMILALFALGLGGSAFLLYRTHPRRVRRRQHLRTLASFPQADFSKDIQTLIGRLADRAGVSPAPEVEIKSSNYSDGQVFGLRGRYVLRLNARSINEIDELSTLWMRRDKLDLHALILHEFGHIANRDIGRSYFARAIWIVFIALVIVPLAGRLIDLQLLGLRRAASASGATGTAWLPLIIWSGKNMLLLAFQIAGLLLVVRAIWGSLLRIREYYADWRAALWGAWEPLEHLLRRRAEQEQHTRSSSWWARQSRRLPAQLQNRALRFGGWCDGLWRFHAPAEERLRRLDNPTLLFQVSPDLPFLTGVLLAFVMIGMPMCITYSYLTVAEVGEIIFWSLAAASVGVGGLAGHILFALVMIMRFAVSVVFVIGMLFIIAYLVERTLGRQMHCEAVARLASRQHDVGEYRTLWRRALLLAAGVELGFVIVPMSILLPYDRVSLLLIPLWLVILTILTWFWLLYVHTLNRWIIGTHSGRTVPKMKRRLVTFCSVLALWSLYLPMLFSRFLIAIVGRIPDVFARMLPPQFPVERFFGMFYGFSLFVLLTLALLLFFLWAALSLGVAYLWMMLKQHHCAACGEQSARGIVIGRRCSYCYSELAGWAYIVPDDRTRSGAAVRALAE